jgi:triphosphoribosyl-dephospho-CoA synthase
MTPVGGLTPSQISDAFIAACRTEVRALKPGNVHVYAAGHGMQVADFDESARVSAPHISNPELRLGARILNAVEATFATVHCNTNLGILLLCAPLAAAASHATPLSSPLEERLRDVLAHLDAVDAAHVFQAIAAANPGGVGTDATADVRQPPPADVTLLDAMQMASPRDLIAQEYVTGFKRVFSLYGHEFAPRMAKGWSPEDSIARVYLHALARAPDTHIGRKFGPGSAHRVRDRAAAVEAQHFSDAQTRPSDPVARRALLEFDAELKAAGFNPGSLADVMAAILFVAELEDAAPAS